MKKQKKDKKAELSAVKKKKLSVYLFFLAVIPMILYFRVVNFSFTEFDDHAIISSIYNITGGSSNIKEAFTHDAFMSDRGDLFYRPVQTVSFMIDSQIGGQKPGIYHFTNLLLHILTVIALFFFLKKTGIKEEISFLLSLFFSIHPLLTNAIAWIPARGDILAGLFSLVSFIAFLEYFETKKYVYLWLHSFAFLLALFSKETSVLVPVLILIYYYFVQKKVILIKELTPFLSLWVCSYAIFYFLRQNVVRVGFDPNTFGLIPLIDNLQAIPIIFGKLFIPLNLTTLPFYNNTALIIGVILIAAVIILIYKYASGEKRTILWGAVWFIIFSIPPMLFRAHVIGIGFEYFEYRSYLPVIGILIIAGIIAKELPKRISFNTILKAAIPVILVYGYIAFNHSNDFENPMAFFSSAIESNPVNAFAISERGSEYLRNNNVGLALADYDYSMKLAPEFSTPYYNEGALYNYLNDHTKAEHYFALSLKYDTLHPEAKNPAESSYFALSTEELNLKKYNDAIVTLEKGVMKYPANSGLHDNLAKAYYFRGIALKDMNNLNEAKNDLQKAESLGFTKAREILGSMNGN